MTIHVMLVHASRVIRTAIGNLIDLQQGFRVVAAVGNVQEAIDCLKQTSPVCELILIDGSVVLPGSVSELLAVSSAKVVMLSEFETDGALDACIKEGARGVIGVDADVDHFVKALTKVHEGEYWLNRQATSRILSTLGQPAKELSAEQVKINSLTSKEKLVVRAVLQGNGQTLHNTAQDLKISENTLRNHLTSIYSKLGLVNRTELFIFAQQHFE